ncbi:MAG: mechanosensitive ion channel protein MscS [Alphaproteobacteria bacterium]|nr:MAG: mechanosensitive ion channel protein MscS [Alphaproteobacteria bacterium]
MTRSGRTAGRTVAALLLLLLLPILLLAAAPARAQEQPAAPAFSAEEVDAILRTIEDPEQRAKLVEQLKLLKAARETEEEPPLAVHGVGAALLEMLSERVQAVARGFSAMGRVLLATPEVAAGLIADARDPAVRQKWLEIAGKLVLVLGSGFLARWVVGRLLRRPSRGLEARRHDAAWVKALMLVVRGLLELLPVAAFAAAAYGVLPLTEPRPATRLVVLAFVNANIIVQVVRAVAAMMLAPHAPAMRLPRMSDETAHYVFIWVIRLAAISVYGYFTVQAALLLGFPPPAYAMLLRALGLFVAGMIVVLILQNRVAVADRLRGRPRTTPMGAALAQERPAVPGTLGQRVAEVWHILAIVYVAAIYVIWALAVPGGFEFLLRATVLTAVVLILLRIALALLRQAVTRGFALSQDLRQRFPRLEGRANRFLPGFEKLLRIVLYVVAALWLLEIWGVDSFAWLESEFGRRLTGGAVTIVIVLLLAVLLLEITDVFIERYLASKDALGNAVARSARVRTLLPLLRNAVRVVVAVVVTLIVLSEIGVNIAPLLAGAGVVGLAIGFGAQTLVKDVITGFFILAEDTVSIGDVVDIGGASGSVEAMTIRSIRLRDGNGSVHTIPFSSVTTVKNMTKDFAYASFSVGVAYDSDVDQVTQAMRDVAAGMRESDEFRYSMLEDLEVIGLDKFTEAGLVVLARIKTPAGKQWGVAREFNRRLKALFDERGIEMPFPQRTVHFIAEQPPPPATESRKIGVGDPAKAPGA